MLWLGCTEYGLANRKSVLAANFQFSRAPVTNTMPRCASVRTRGSFLQCEDNAVWGHTLCSRHARNRTHVLWAQAHNARGIEKVQALGRGWLVRRRLELAGPGVLHRVGLANDEDVFTYEVKDRQFPLEYVSFEENGKVWWFDFGGLWRWCGRAVSPVNPYTKVPLSMETRRRLHAGWALRVHLGLPLPAEPVQYSDRLQHRITLLTQTFLDFGFIDVRPHEFLHLEKEDYSALFALLKPDIETILPESDPFREHAIRLCARASFAVNVMKPERYVLQCVYTLMTLLALHKNAYAVAFTILSARIRCG